MRRRPRRQQPRAKGFDSGATGGGGTAQNKPPVNANVFLQRQQQRIQPQLKSPESRFDAGPGVMSRGLQFRDVPGSMVSPALQSGSAASKCPLPAPRSAQRPPVNKMSLRAICEPDTESLLDRLAEAAGAVAAGAEAAAGGGAPAAQARGSD